MVSTVVFRTTRQAAKYTWNYDLSSPRDAFLPSIWPQGSEKESPPVLLENYSIRERVRAHIVYVDTTHTPCLPATHTSAVASILTHPHLPRCYIGLAHTRPGSLAAGSVGEAEERIPCSPPFVPRTPEQRADDQWNRESGAVPLVSANMAALRLAHPPADTVRRKIHFVHLSSILPFPPIVPRTFHCRGASSYVSSRQPAARNFTMQWPT